MIFASEYWVFKKAYNFSATNRNSLWSIDSENSDLFLKLLSFRLHRQTPASCSILKFVLGVLGSQKSAIFFHVKNKQKLRALQVYTDILALKINLTFN